MSLFVAGVVAFATAIGIGLMAWLCLEVGYRRGYNDGYWASRVAKRSIT